MTQTLQEKNKALVLEAFDTLFNRREYAAAERFWSPSYIQHSAHIAPGREGLFNLVRSLPPTLKYEPGVIAADGDFVIVHGRFSGLGAPANWIAADILRIQDGILVEHWDVIQDEATREQSKSGRPMFSDSFPSMMESEMSGFTFPAGFRSQEISTNGVTIHTRIGGAGPAVILLHGYGETGDMWVPLAVDLARDHTVIIPDLRGLGRSSKPDGGFDKKTQARDVAGVLAALRIEQIDLVTHDIGNMVGFAFAAQHAERVKRFVLIDAPLPGVGPWEEVLKNPMLWHFRFGGPDMERLVAGRERIYLDRFWNEFSAEPSRFSEAARKHYAQLYALPGAMHSGFAQFAAFDQDAIDNRAFLAKGKLAMPVLAVGGAKSFGTTMAAVMRFAATVVEEAVVPDAGHWIMEENPRATIQIVRGFLDGTPSFAG